MTSKNAVHAAVPLTVLAAATALTVTITFIAPGVGSEVMLALIGAWTMLVVVRIALIVSLARRFYRRFAGAAVS